MKLTVVEAVVWLWSIVFRPDHMSCPHGTWLMTGVQSDGSATCWPDVVGPLDDMPGGEDPCVQPPGTLWVRVYCSAGEVPVQDGVSLWCRSP